MLRLFKSLRQDLLTKNKMLSYSAYALGEIALVVIGILIAVKIGDISEQRKQAEEFQVALREVESSLINEIQQAEYIYSIHAGKDSLCDLVLAGRATKEMYFVDITKPNTLNNLFTHFEVYNVQDNGFLEIQKNIKHAPEKYDTLIKRLQMFNSFNVPLATLKTSEIMKMRLAIREDWAKKYPWASNVDNPSNNPAFMEYLLNSWEYKNLVALYKDPISTMTFIANSLSMEASQNLALLRTLNGTPQEAIDRERFALLKVDTIRVEKCPSEMPTWDYTASLIRQFIFLNRRTETVRIYHDFTNGKLDERFNAVEPNQSITLIAEPYVSYIIKNEKGECLGSSTAGRNNGVVIIE